MALLLQMYVALSALSFIFVSACQDGKLTILFCFFFFVLFISFIALLLVIAIVYFCALTSTSYMTEKKLVCHYHDVCVVEVILRCFNV